MSGSPDVEGVEVEPGDVGVELVLDDHPFGVADRRGPRPGLVKSSVISRVGCSWPMLRMAICSNGTVDSFEAHDVLVDLGWRQRPARLRL